MIRKSKHEPVYLTCIGAKGRRPLSSNKLAIHGGTPAVHSTLPPWPPQSPAIADSVHNTLQDGSWGEYHGWPVQSLIQRLQSQFSVAHAWPCSSGTLGVELALRGCGVRPGDEVILAGYDFPGNFRAIESVGAVPVLVDVIAKGWTLETQYLSSAISDKTTVVIASHLHGELCDMVAIMEICRGTKIRVIEDACQVPGATVAGKLAGTQGDIGVLSFGGSKLLTAGRGGAVITDCEDILQRIRIAADRGNDAWPLSSLQAAALLPQMDMLDGANATRLENAKHLRQAIRQAKHFQTTGLAWTECNVPAFYKFPLTTSVNVERDFVIAALQAEGIPADTGFRGFLRRAPRRCRAVGELIHSRIASERTILIHHPLLSGSPDIVAQVCAGIKKVDQWISDELPV